MADVFISYAKTDRPLALKLAAMLEAEGWSVWWDTSLAIGDDFRNEIMTELGRARAVIVIWTDASIKSDWVRSETGRAQADRKLIPVKLEHLTYKDLPPPFDVLHTEDIGQDDKIRAAVVAQLAKPAVEPSAWALLTKGFRYELLTWVGIVGGAWTLFARIGGVFALAPLAQVLVQNWNKGTHAFWVWAFGWLGIHLAPELTPVLSFVLFGSLLTIGQAVKFNTTIKNQANVDTYQGKSFRLISWRTLLCVVCACLPLIIYLSFLHLLTDSAPVEVAIFLAFLLLAAPPLVIVLFARHKVYTALSTFLTTTFFMIIAVFQLAQIVGDLRVSYRDYQPPVDPDLLGFSVFALNIALMILLLSVAPAKAVSRRLIFLAIGLVLLIGLNELSRLLHEWGL